MVTHLWVHFDTLMTFSTEAGDVVTTEDHPFWNVTDQAWEGPQDFDAGDTVLTADGQLVEVGQLDWDTSYVGLAYNLTVDDIHTYYVEIGAADVLVIERRAAQVDCEIHPISGRFLVVVGGGPAGIRSSSNDETR